MEKSSGSSNSLKPGDVHAFHLGQLLFGDDLQAIYSVLLPALKASTLQLSPRSIRIIARPSIRSQCVLPFILRSQIDDLVRLHSAYTTAASYVGKLRDAGTQPGSLVSGNARIRLLKHLSTGVFQTQCSCRPGRPFLWVSPHCPACVAALYQQRLFTC